MINTCIKNIHKSSKKYIKKYENIQKLKPQDIMKNIFRFVRKSSLFMANEVTKYILDM